MAVEVVDGVRRPLHYAGCGDYGVDGPGDCAGCVPVECRDGSLICDRCFGKARALLNDAPDLLARLRSIGDAAKSKWNWEDGPIVRTTSVHAPAPVAEDLLDATHAVEQAIWFYSAGIDTLANNVAAVTQLGPLVLDLHPPDEDGVRATWSILDALKRYGLERRDTHRHVFPGNLPNAPLGSYAKFDEEEQPTPVTEYFERPISVKQAAELAGVGVREVQKWVTAGMFERRLRWREGGAWKTYLYPSDVEAVAKEQAAKRKRTFPAKAD